MWSPVLQWLMKIGMWHLAFLIWLISRVISLFRTKATLPPITNKLLLHSAKSLAEMIRTRQVSCESVVQAYIDRVNAVNPALNCVVQERFEQALQEARLIDVQLSSSEKTEEQLRVQTPLLGVPITIKESIAVQGMSNNAGRLTPKERIASKDATAVASLKSAGAIPLLVSNTPELCQCWETYNKVTGRTNNPFDTRRTPGGSSGGEAALLSSAGSVIGLGSDIGGSGRLPAMFCGIFGHKPSSGSISTDGHMPFSDDPEWASVFAFSPMCRYAEDLPLMFSACVHDKEKIEELRLNEPVDFSQLKIYYMEEEGSILSSSPESEIKAGMHKVLEYLKTKYSVIYEKVKIDELRDAEELTSVLMLRMKATQNAFQKSEDDVSKWNSMTWEFLKWLFRRSEHTFHALLYGLTKRIADNVSDGEIRKLEEQKKILLQKFDDLLGKDGVLLYPVFPTPAHYHLQIYYRLLNTSYMALCNLLDLPATACPLGLNKKGLPIGIQVIASTGQDRLTLALAQEIEKGLGGWISPSPVELTEVKC